MNDFLRSSSPRRILDLFSSALLYLNRPNGVFFKFALINIFYILSLEVYMSQWKDSEAEQFVRQYTVEHGEDVALRVYSSRLIGKDSSYSIIL